MKTVQISTTIYKFHFRILLWFLCFSKHSTLSKKKKICINKVRCVPSGDWDRDNNKKKRTFSALIQSYLNENYELATTLIEQTMNWFLGVFFFFFNCLYFIRWLMKNCISKKRQENEESIFKVRTRWRMSSFEFGSKSSSWIDYWLCAQFFSFCLWIEKSESLP